MDEVTYKTIYHPVTGLPCGTAAADDVEDAVRVLRGKPPEDKTNPASKILARAARDGAKARMMTGYSAIGQVRK